MSIEIIAEHEFWITELRGINCEELIAMNWNGSLTIETLYMDVLW